MNGNRTLGELESVLPGVSPRLVRAAVSLLVRCGLVEEGVGDEAVSASANPETLAFLRRHAGATRINRSGSAAYAKLQASHVLVVDSGASRQQIGILKSLLEITGIGKVTPLAAQSVKTWCPSTDTSLTKLLVVSLSLTGENCEWHAELDDWCAGHQLAWLRAVMDVNQNCMDIGPLFRNNESPCFCCFREIHGLARNIHNQSAQAPSADAYFWTSMVALEVTYWLSQVGVTVTAKEFQRFDLQRWQARPLRCARIPGCARCRPLTPSLGSSGLMDTAVVFEDYVSLQSRAFSSLEAQKQHSQMSIVLARQAKRLPNCKQLTLNREVPKLERDMLKVLRSDRADSNQRLALKELGTILLTTAGIRDLSAGHGKVQRWASTAGNLGSVELFVLVRDVDGLPAGIYFYQSHDHALAWFQRRNGGLPVEDFMRRVAPSNARELPGAMVLFTAAFHRVARKYGAFGYRLIQLDAGAALSQLHVVSESLNIRSRTVSLWASDLLEDQLNLEPFLEQATAVATLSRCTENGTPDTAGLDGQSVIRPGLPLSIKPAHDFCGLALQQVVEMVYREGRLQEHELLLGAFAVPPEVLDTQMTETPVPGFSSFISLPSPAQGGRSVGDILAERTSIREFSPDPVSLDALSTMLDCAHQGDVRDWPDEHDAGQPLNFLVLAWQVNLIRPAVYSYDSRHHGLLFLHPIPSPRNARELFVQREFASARLVLWITGNLAAACCRYGAAGHRQLLLRAGSAGHRLWMAAMAMGLSGCLVAGLVPGAARRQLGLDGYRKASLLAFATGHQAGRLATDGISVPQKIQSS